MPSIRSRKGECFIQRDTSKYPIEQSRRNLTSCLVDVNREARIRALCAKASATTEISEVDAALAELRAELHKHIEELRAQDP